MAMSRTRKTVLIVTSIVVGLVLVALIGLAVVISAFGGMSQPSPTIACLHAPGPVTTGLRPYDPLRKFFGPRPITHRSILQFKKAKVDKRIKVVLLEIDMSGAGWGESEKSATRLPTSAPR